jgi:hypothetical protein
LIEMARQNPSIVVGLDFAFSAPRWYLERLGLRSATELWHLASLQGEGWLSACEPPFWGRVRGTRPLVPAYYRRADLMQVGGISPKSVFQIGGPGQVGTGSVRGWPCLSRLRQAGFAVWPFEEARVPLAIEIYPRLLTGPVKKSRPEARLAYLEQHHAGIAPGLRELAAASEDAFDAAVSAVVMSRHEAEFGSLPKVNDRTSLLEGLIWKPDGNAY